MTVPLPTVEVIERTMAGLPLDGAEVEGFVRSWTSGSVSDAQMAAWCMAVCLRGLPADGATALTRALVASGDRLELGRLGPTGDKHSTGGVGDSVTLVAAPLAAALGVRVAKTSGHGLGHTGGTLDKLAAIPGMRVDLPLDRFVRQVRDIGIAVVGQSDRLVPADRRLYALRDQTATVSGTALVAGSVMSKKIAGGASALVLDVKAGGGAFFPDTDAATEAAVLMAGIARPWGRRVRWLVTDMDEPVGVMVGNALEVRQSGEVLRGGGPPRLRELAVRVAGELAEAAGVLADGEGAAAASRALSTGAALAVAERWVEAQGGDPAVWTAPERLPAARMREEVRAAGGGIVGAVDARRLGEAARWLGAGRLSRGQVVDPAVGVELAVRVGDRVAAGDLLATVHAQDSWLAGRAVDMVTGAVTVADAAAAPRPLVLASGRG